MKCILPILALVITAPLFGQGVRVDLALRASGPNVPVSGGPLPQSLILANAKVSICTHPTASIGACTPVTTYTDVTLTTPCPTNTPIVQLPGSACVATTGVTGNLGFWYAGGVVDYFVSGPYGLQGPYTTSGGTVGPPSTVPGPPGPPGGAANITPSPQFSLFYQPLSGTQSQAQGDSHVTTDGAGHMQAITTTASVNKVISVIAPPYNAKCDGTTDDQTAIQAAFTAAYSGGQQIQFPAGTCLTSTIVWKGQSFFGAGKGITFIQGQPGQDVFQTPDNNSYVLLAGATVHDLNIVVNVTVNAAATAGGGNNTFPNRIAGIPFGGGSFPIPIVPGAVNLAPGAPATCGATTGVNATATTTTATLVCTLGIGYDFAGIDPGLVIGAPISIAGAGAAGADYSGTITGVSSGCAGGATCVLSVSPAIGTTVTHAAGLALNPQTPPWYIGNAGMALQCTNGNACQINATSWNIYNLEFYSTPTTYIDAAHSDGFFTQSAVYASHFEKLLFEHLYAAYVEAAPISGRVATGDTSSFKDIDVFNSILAMVTYQGNNRALTNMNFYNELPLNSGPFFLNPGSAPGATWVINQLYSEGNWGQTGETQRFSNASFRIHAADIFNGTNAASWIEFAGNESYVDGIFGSGLKVDGNLNNFRNTNNAASSITDNGYGNIFDGLLIQGTNNYWGRRFNQALIPPRDSLGKFDASFLLAGNSAAPYLNSSDLLTTCEDWTFSFNPGLAGAQGTCVPDPTGTEPSRRYFQSANATQTFTLTAGGTAYQNAWTGAGRTFAVSNTNSNGGPSSIVPATKLKISVQGQCVGASTCTATARLRDLTANSTVGATGSVTFTNNWTVQSWTADASAATAGDSVGFQFDTWTNTGTNYNIGWVGIEPLNQDQLGGLSVSGTVGASLTTTVANGTAAMTTAAITAPACGATVTVVATGALTTDAIQWAFNAAPAGTNAGLVAGRLRVMSISPIVLA